MSTEDSGQDRLLDHNYDGIQEYDNPMPRWWVWIFWATIAYSALYALNLPGIGIGRGRIAAYEAEVAKADARRAAEAQAAGPVTDPMLLALARDPKAIDAGRTVFVANCAPCHREDGGGNIGPNLTDDYWLHGGRPVQILATIRSGAQEKGMPAWDAILKPDDVKAATAFILTLHDTHPPGAKEAQGVKEEDVDEEDSD